MTGLCVGRTGTGEFGCRLDFEGFRAGASCVEPPVLPSFVSDAVLRSPSGPATWSP